MVWNGKLSGSQHQRSFSSGTSGEDSLSCMRTPLAWPGRTPNAPAHDIPNGDVFPCLCQSRETLDIPWLSMTCATWGWSGLSLSHALHVIHGRAAGRSVRVTCSCRRLPWRTMVSLMA